MKPVLSNQCYYTYIDVIVDLKPKPVLSETAINFFLNQVTIRGLSFSLIFLRQLLAPTSLLAFLSDPEFLREMILYQILILSFSYVHLVHSKDISVFSAKENVALSKFRNTVVNELYTDYMKTDEYLIRWIRDQDFDLEKARNKLKNALKWRRDNVIDSISTEVMGNMSRHFPYDIDGKDNDGRPILLIPYSKWDIRKRMITEGAIGRTQLARYNDQLLERGAIKIRQSKHPQTEQAVTQAIVLIDLNGYNQRQHGCAACLPFYYDLLTHYEMYYPQLVKNFIFINTPKIFETVANFILTIISPATKDIIKIYDHDKSEWDAELKRRIPSSQLPPQFGGNKPKMG